MAINAPPPDYIDIDIHIYYKLLWKASFHIEGTAALEMTDFHTTRSQFMPYDFLVPFFL